MSQRRDLTEGLHRILGDEPGIAVIHSSIANLRLEQPTGRWDVLFAVRALVERGWTVALPAFTFEFCEGKPFFLEGSPSGTGILADWLLTAFPEARRTAHPIYSFAVLGPESPAIMDCPSPTTFGDGSPFDLFEQRNAKMVMLGCGWEYCTQFHHYEEKAAVPYRHFKDFKGTADYGDGMGARDASARMFVRDLEIEPENDFSPIWAKLEKTGRLAKVELQYGLIQCATARDIGEVAEAELTADSWSLVKDRSVTAYRASLVARKASQDPVRVAILGSANLALLKAGLEKATEALVPDLGLKLYTPDYGQLFQAILDPNGRLYAHRAELTLFCDRLEDLIGVRVLDEAEFARAEKRVADYVNAIETYRSQASGWIVVHRFASAADVGRADARTLHQDFYERMNGLLRERLEKLEQVVFLDVAAEAAHHPCAVNDARLWFVGRYPYGDDFSRALGRKWAGLLLALKGKTARLVVLDLDNTLWGGVLGEDGIDGLHLGGDYPGNAFMAFQKVIKGVYRRGIALAVCSNNDEDLALQALRELPDMQIGPDDLVSYRIDWNPKWQNIKSLCEEFNLGHESVLFIDDNPVEREGVRRNLPGVRVLDLPPDPALYADTLAHTPWLEALEVTAEDMKRVDSYKARKKIEEIRQGAANLEDFYADLGMILHVQNISDENAARAVQLCQKTNQFNATTRRHQKSDLTAMRDAGADVVVLGLEDRYSDFENIGLIVLKPNPEVGTKGIVESYLLSCRVLGRGLETAVLGWAVKRAKFRGWSRLDGQIVETERNTPVRDVFKYAGFEASDEPGWWHHASDEEAAMPSWLTMVDHLSES